MKRNQFSFLAASVMLLLAFWGWAPAARAALCGKCRDLLFIDSEGKCSVCGSPTTSGALQICPKCSAKRHQCEHCLGATTAADEAASEAASEAKPTDPPPEKPPGNGAQGGESPGWSAPGGSTNSAKPDDTAAKPTGPEMDPLPQAAEKKAGAAPPETESSPSSPPALPGKLTPVEDPPGSKPPAELPSDPTVPVRLKPINPAKAGTYTSGKWRFQLQITNPGTRNEGRWGWLTYDGQKLPRGSVNDYYDAPWGPIYWVDVPTTAWGLHGWMPAPLAQNQRQGRALAVPKALLADQTPQSDVAPANTGSSATPATAAAAKPRMQKLEINKSHNGQFARLHVGNVLVIRLPGNPATGYQWQAASTNSPAVRLTVRPQYSPPEQTATAAAASGTYTFTFQAVQPGSGSIRLYYIRPNDPSHPRDTFAVGVNVLPLNKSVADKTNRTNGTTGTY